MARQSAAERDRKLHLKRSEALLKKYAKLRDWPMVISTLTNMELLMERGEL